MKIFYESQKNLHNLIYESDGKMFLRVDEENNCEKSNINMIFDLGVASNEKSEKIRKLLYLLTAHKDGGLYTLVRRVFEEDRPHIKPPIKDEYFSGFSGLFKTELKTENGRIIYDLKLMNDFSEGVCHFDLGVAIRNDVNLIKKSVEIFEKDYFNVFVLKLQEISKL